MADSFNKKEREKKKRKKRQDKADLKKHRKENGESLPEFMYVDHNGNITATPPEPIDKEDEIALEDIEVSVPKKAEGDVVSFVKQGHVKFFNTEKGYGFIIDKATKDSFFVHIDGCQDVIKDNDKVEFEVGKGPKGPIAMRVKLIKL